MIQESRSRELFWKIFIYRIYFLLIVLQGISTTFLLFRIPRDPKNALVFGLSAERLILISVPIFFVITGGYLFFKSWKHKIWLNTFDNRAQAWLSRKQRWSRIGLFCIGFIIAGSIILLALLRESFFVLAPPEKVLATIYYMDLFFRRVQPFLVRLQPLVILGIGLCVQTLFVLPLISFGIKACYIKLKTHKIYHIAGIYGVFLMLWGILGWTQLKLVPDYSTLGWYPLGSPILDNQVYLACGVGFALLVVGIVASKTNKKIPQLRKISFSDLKIDLAIGLVIWLVAAFHWSSVPLQTNWFVSAPRFPNFEYYPNSDAILYDATAQSLLVGEGFKSWTSPNVRRPMYALFLAVLYSIVGQDYETVTLVQSAIFAVFPLLIYLITKTLHNRLSALIAATLILLREGNAIALADRITVSHSRLFMSEMPTTVGIVLLVWIIILWSQQPERRYKLPLIAGGVLATTMLIRNEVGVLAPLLVLFMGIILLRKPKLWLKNTLLLSLGVLLFLTPWMWQNWRLSGYIYLDRSDRRVQYFFHRIGLGEENALPQTSEAPGDEDVENVSNVSFIQRFRNHYIHNLVQAVLIFPDASRVFDSAVGYFLHNNITDFWKVCCSRLNYIRRFAFWQWRQWDASLPIQSMVPILANLFFIAVGIVKVWERQGIRGLLPLLVSFTHYFVNSIAGFSGGRFVHVVEWTWIIYYSVGLGQVITWVVASLSATRLPKWLIDKTSEGGKLTPDAKTFKEPLWYTYAGVGLIVFLFGATLPLAEEIVQPRYTEQTKQVWLNEMLQSETVQANALDASALLRNFLRDNGKVLQGRAFYPRYYPIGEGEPGSKRGIFSPRDFSHFSFYLLGPQNVGVQLPLQERPDIEFPNASDVLVFGCQNEESFYPLGVFIIPSETVLFRSPLPKPTSCPISSDE